MADADKLESETPKTAIHISGSVGAGGDNNTADVIGVEMHLNLFIFDSALKGVTKPLFTFGKMTEEFIDVIRAFQKQIVGSSNPDGRVDPNGKTIKFLNGPLSARGGQVTPGKIKPPADVMAARKKIAETAGFYLNQGGHFLIGAYGDMPGVANGHPLRASYTMPATFMEKTHPLRLGPAVHAAWVRTGRHGLLGCMGRPERRGTSDGAILPGDSRVAMLDDYMASIARMRAAGMPTTRWPGFNVYEKNSAAFNAASSFAEFDRLCPDLAKMQDHLYPRRINPDGLIHLGESCVGRRHYDCIGFVNFVLSKVLTATWKQTMEFYMKDSTKFDVTEFKDGRKDDVRGLAEEGDIVLKDPADSHCGICRVFEGRIVVTNCRSMGLGLLSQPLIGEWKFLARLRAV